MIYSCEQLQNEFYYLKAAKDSAIIKEIISNHNWYKYHADKDKHDYANSIKVYRELLKLVAEYFKTAGVGNNSIVLSILLRKLIFDGYFSVDNKFKADSRQTFKDLTSFEGMDIIQGRGCCRHLAGFYDDVFSEMAIYNTLFTCYSDMADISLDEAFVRPANHVVNLVKYDDTIYGYDCFSNAIFQAVDEFTMAEIVNLKSVKPSKLYYKPSAAIMSSDVTYEEAMAKLKLLEENSKRKYITFLEYLNFKKETGAIIDKNSDLFGDLKNESKKYTRKISETMKEDFQNVVLDYYG